MKKSTTANNVKQTDRHQVILKVNLTCFCPNELKNKVNKKSQQLTLHSNHNLYLNLSFNCLNSKRACARVRSSGTLKSPSYKAPTASSTVCSFVRRNGLYDNSSFIVDGHYKRSNEHKYKNILLLCIWTLSRRIHSNKK